MAWADVLSEADVVFQGMSFYLNKIIIVLVIILFGFIIGKIVESILRRVLAGLNTDEYLTKIFKARRNYARAIRRTIVRIIYLITILIALEYLSIVMPVLYGLLLCAIIVIIVSLVLVGIDIVPNLTARSLIRHKRFGIGDEITVIDRTGVLHGTIADITLLEVQLKRRNGDVIFIPNAVFLKDKVIRKRLA